MDIKLPDGTIVRGAPDNLSPDDLAAIQAAAASAAAGDAPWQVVEQPSPVQVPQKVPQRGTKSVTNTGQFRPFQAAAAGAAQGLLGLPALAADLASYGWASTPMKEAEVAGVPLGGSKEFPYSKALQSLAPENMTTGEKLLHSGSSGLVGGIAYSPTRPLQGAASGLAAETAALGAEAVSKKAGNEASLLPTAAGLLAGAGAWRLSGGAKTAANVHQLARESLSGIPKDTLLAAQKLMQDYAARPLPVHLDLAQALEILGADNHSITTVRNAILQSSKGKKLQELHSNQPLQYQLNTDAFIRDQPGTIRPVREASAELVQQANDRFQQAKEGGRAIFDPIYAKAGPLPVKTIFDVVDAAQTVRSRPGASEAVQKAADRLIKKLEARVAETGGVHARDLDTWIREVTGGYKAPSLAQPRPDPKAVGDLKYFAKQLDTLLKGASPAISAGDAAFKKYRQEVINPLKAGPIGTLAGQRGFDAGKGYSTEGLKYLFESGVDPRAGLSKSPIRQAAAELAKVPPNPRQNNPGGAEVFRSAFKSWLSDSIGDVRPVLLAGEENQSRQYVQQLYSKFFEKENTFQGLRDAVASVAKISGKSESDAVRGLEAFRKLTKAMTNAPQKLSGIGMAEVADMAGANLAAGALRLSGQGTYYPARLLYKMQVHKTLAAMDSLLSTPEGITTLIKLSRTPIMSTRAVEALTAFNNAQMTLPDRPQE